MDMSKIDLNAPAFGVDAQKIEEQVTPAVVEELPKVEPKEEAPKEESEEESKVPYSRFKKFHDRAKEAEEEANYWRQQVEQLKQPVVKEETDIPSFWVELYGDTEASKKAWKVQQQVNESIRSEAKREAIEAVMNQRQEEEQKVEENLSIIDEKLSNLSDLIGKELTEKEQSAILDIVDDFTPKDKDGNYAGDPVPFEKAWEIYQLRNDMAKAPGIKSRNTVAGLTNSQSSGETSVAKDKDADFNPLDWNSWKKRI